MVETTTANREIVITRVYDAPRELVFDAWTSTEHLHKWWGPRGFTTTTHSMDFRPGGMWRFIMHGPDGTDYPNRITYTEIVRPEHLLYEHSDDEEGGLPHFLGIITFADRDGKTELTLKSIFPTAEARDFVVEKYGAIEGGNQTLDRLGEYLAGKESK